jgi:hypothetical protein
MLLGRSGVPGRPKAWPEKIVDRELILCCSEGIVMRASWVVSAYALSPRCAPIIEHLSASILLAIFFSLLVVTAAIINA